MQKKSFMSWYFDTSVLLRVLIGLVLGGTLGILLTEYGGIQDYLKIFGDIFVRLLKMIVMPVIIASIVVGASSIRPAKLGKTGVKIISYYLLTSFIAIMVGLLVANTFSLGKGLNLVGESGVAAREATSVSFATTLLQMIPSNPFNAFSEGKVLPTIVFFLFFGLSLAFGRDSSDPKISKPSEMLFQCFEAFSSIIFRVVGWVMQYAPIGVFALIFVVFAKNAPSAFGPLLAVTGTVYGGLLFLLLGVYSTLAICFKIHPIKFLSRLAQPMVTAFVTRSSSGTLPVTMETAEKKMGVSRNVYSFTLPIGATINMDGTTIHLGLATIFIANAVGIPLDFAAQASIIITAVVGGIGAAGVPGTGIIMLLMVLESVGLRMEEGSAVAVAYAMIFGIDALLEMGRTAVNVVGDMLGTVIVAKSEKEIDASIAKEYLLEPIAD